MIVRDESPVIGRCLESVKPLIDAWVICDTGSTDDTIEVIERSLSKIPGRIHHRPWRDFGWNRSELMALARGSADYLLLLDADMTLERTGPLPELRADVYLLRHAGELAYRVPRLVRGGMNWRFVGSTHEHLAGEGDWSEEVLESLVVQHHADGASRAHKFERDVELLERDLEADPANTRALFYLAQSLRDLGQEERALELYQRRAIHNGWDEERFYAAYQVGSLLARRDDDDAIEALLSAWGMRPHRAEPLYELARFCRFRRWHGLAHFFASRAAALPFPDDALFVHRWVYDWGLQLELAQSAYWIGETKQAIGLADAALADAAVPPAIAGAFREARFFSVAKQGGAGASSKDRPARRRTPMLTELGLSFDAAEVRLDVEPAWSPFNPTIAADGDSYRMIVRTADYKIEDGRWVSLSGDDVVRTINYAIRLDRDLEPQEIEPLGDTSDGPARHPSKFDGYEDCRLFTFEDRWFATATVRDRNPRQRCQMALLELEENTVASVTLLHPPKPTEHEKNWMPLPSADGIRFIYSCTPTIVVGCDPRTGVCQTVASHQGPPGMALRGGSQALAVDDGFLCIVHEARSEDGRRLYDHRLVLLDEQYRIAALSSPFAFVSQELEFCAGLARRGDQLLICFGVEDQAAMLGVLGLGEALAMLEPGPSVRSLLT